MGSAKKLFQGWGQKTAPEVGPKWGDAVFRERKMNEIRVYHDSLAQADQFVDPQTWRDLDMDSVFEKIDRTVSALGQQVLYHQIHSYADSEVLSDRAKQQEFFLKDLGAREAILSLLSKFDGPGSDWLALIVLNPLPGTPRHSWIIYCLSLLALACLVGTAMYGPTLLAFFGILLVNAVVHTKYGARITPYYRGFSQIGAMLSIGKQLSQLPNNGSLPQIKVLRDAEPISEKLRKRLGWVTMADPDSLRQPARTAVEFLNTYFLFDIIVFLRSLATLRQNQKVLREILDAVGSLDASISAASYWKSLSIVTRPQIVEARELRVSGIYHPLISDAVSNSLALNGRSVLVAGPNMAGKTAFIKTVGINLILSRSLNLCLASSAVLPRATVQSSIKREDALEEGKSYFFVEIDQILDFVKNAAHQKLRLFLIDEPFRGTNTVERIAISSAVLRHLAERQIVMASTHDVELQSLLGDSFDMVNFSDHVTGETYGFDYKIRSGPATSRNAIRLLEIRGYPASIIGQAEQAATRLSISGETTR